jgi:hypothetical protein
MIVCPTCGTSNEDLAHVCSSCKAYIQAKVEILDLFSTAWGVIEEPLKTFQRIALAKTKNYSIFLSALIGCAGAFAMMWYLDAGRRIEGLAAILGGGMVAGPILGILLIGLLSLVAATAAKVLRGVGSMKNSVAALAYAGIPIILSLVVIFPLEIALFGSYLFDANPSPKVFNPLAYFVLFGLDAAAVLWTIALSGVSLAKANQLSIFRGYVVSGILLAVLAAAVFAVKGLWG